MLQVHFKQKNIGIIIVNTTLRVRLVLTVVSFSVAAISFCFSILMNSCEIGSVSEYVISFFDTKTFQPNKQFSNFISKMHFTCILFLRYHTNAMF